MPSKWIPPTDSVGKNEPIGRRLFDEPMLSGASDQPFFDGLDIRNFEPVEGDLEFSVDRLGQSGITKSVREYLRLRAAWEGGQRRPPRKFNGWIYQTAGMLAKERRGKQYPVVPSPIKGEGLKENIYHAHIHLTKNQSDPEVVAHLIRYAFTKGGKSEIVQNAERGNPSESLMYRVMVKTQKARGWLLGSWKGLKKKWR